MIFFRDGPPSPQDRPTSPGPDIEPESDPQPRCRAVAHVRPISIADIVRDVSGPDPMRVVQDFDRIYMPEGGGYCAQFGSWSTRRGGSSL